jgi:hypothetical protein
MRAFSENMRPRTWRRSGPASNVTGRSAQQVVKVGDNDVDTLALRAFNSLILFMGFQPNPNSSVCSASVDSFNETDVRSRDSAEHQTLAMALRPSPGMRFWSCVFTRLPEQQRHFKRNQLKQSAVCDAAPTSRLDRFLTGKADPEREWDEEVPQCRCLH